MLIMREILRWDFSGVTNQIWKVTTALIPRIVSKIRRSSKGVPPKDTEIKCATTGCHNRCHNQEIWTYQMDMGILTYNFRIGDVVQLVWWSGPGPGRPRAGLYKVCTTHGKYQIGDAAYTMAQQGKRGVRQLYQNGCMGGLRFFWPDRLFKYEPWITGKFGP
jgi:hypothetical protein